MCGCETKPDILRGKDIAISVNTNTRQTESIGVKELRIREKVNWVDGCEEYSVTLPSYFYRYSPFSYVLYNLMFSIHTRFSFSCYFLALDFQYTSY